MSFMEIMFLIPFIMLAIALYAAFDAIAAISFDDEEIEEEDQNMFMMFAASLFLMFGVKTDITEYCEEKNKRYKIQKELLK